MINIFTKLIKLYDDNDNDILFSWETELEKDDFDDEFSDMLHKFINKHNGMIKIYERNPFRLVDFNRKNRKSLYRMTTIMNVDDNNL